MAGRTMSTLCLCVLLGCTGAIMSEEVTPRGPGPGEPPGGGPPPPPGTMPGEPYLAIDVAETDPYVPMATPSGTVRGVVMSSEGVSSLTVGGSLATVNPDSTFTASVPLSEPGLTTVEVVATDTAEAITTMPVSFMHADFLPDGEMNEAAAIIEVRDGLLDALTGDLLGDAGLDLTSAFPPGTPLIEGDICNLYSGEVHHGTPTLSLGATEDGNLRATIRVPDLSLNFGGQCNALGQRITVRDSSQADETTIAVDVVLAAAPTAPGECISGFTLISSQVRIETFDLDLRLSGGSGLGGLLIGAAGELVGELAEGFVKGMLEDEAQALVMEEADSLLAGLDGIEINETMDFFGAEVGISLCITGLGPEDGRLIAQLGASVMGTPISAPTGAPVYFGEPPAMDAETPLLLDTNLVSQLLYAAWSGGALNMEDIGADLPITVNVGLLRLYAAELAEHYDLDTEIRIDIEAALAPMALAGEGDADMMLHLGDLLVKLSTPEGPLFEMNLGVKAGLSLVATPEGALGIEVVEDVTEVEAWLTHSEIELGNRSRNALPDFFASTVQGLLGDILAGAALDLSSLGVPLTVADARPVEGGFVGLTLGTPAPDPAPPAP